VVKIEDGTTTAALAASNFVLTGVVGGESVSVTRRLGAYVSPNVGTGIDVRGNLTSSNYRAATGTQLSNYVLPPNGTCTGTGIGTLNAKVIVPATNTGRGGTAADQPGRAANDAGGSSQSCRPRRSTSQSAVSGVCGLKLYLTAPSYPAGRKPLCERQSPVHPSPL
jgi:hypothetical protein